MIKAFWTFVSNGPDRARGVACVEEARKPGKLIASASGIGKS
jgi:hypothetical protein